MMQTFDRFNNVIVNVYTLLKQNVLRGERMRVNCVNHL